MKKIPWHNPAQQTPPEGYRLLIPEEVDGRFRSEKQPLAQIYSPRLNRWDKRNLAACVSAMSYAVPSDTPLPEGYTLIDGDVWQMNGWTAHTPGAEFDVTHKPPMDPDTLVEVMLRNGEVVKRPMRQHWFNRIPNAPRAEIIGWRVVQQAPKHQTREELIERSRVVLAEVGLPAFKAELNKRGHVKVCNMSDEELKAFVADVEVLRQGRITQQAPKPLMALDEEEPNGLHIPTDAIKAASAQLLGRIESLYRDLADENQRLKNELADAQATIKSIRSLLP